MKGWFKWPTTEGVALRVAVAIALLVVVATGVVPTERVVACLVGELGLPALSSKSSGLQGLVSPSVP